MSQARRRPRAPKAKQPSLDSSARLKDTGRGWAAAQGQRIAYAKPTGSSRPEFFRGRRQEICHVEGCGLPHLPELAWCQKHVDRARLLGAEIPPHRED